MAEDPALSNPACHHQRRAEHIGFMLLCYYTADTPLNVTTNPQWYIHTLLVQPIIMNLTLTRKRNRKKERPSESRTQVVLKVQHVNHYTTESRCGQCQLHGLALDLYLLYMTVLRQDIMLANSDRHIWCGVKPPTGLHTTDTKCLLNAVHRGVDRILHSTVSTLTCTLAKFEGLCGRPGCGCSSVHLG